MEVKETIKKDIKLKGVAIADGKLYDADGVVIPLVESLQAVYGAAPFDISVSAKREDVSLVEDLMD